MTTAVALDVAPAAPASARRRWLRRYALAVAGGVVILFWFAVAFLAPVISPYNPNFVDIAARLQAPSAAHWMGTDALGRDVLSRVLFGSRISLIAGFSVVLVSAVFGTVLGAIAAYARGRVEDLLMRLTDLVLCFPPIILAMAIAAALGIGTTNTIIAMLVVWWPKYARLARSLVLVQRAQEYVEAAHVLGFGHAHILFRHVVPNAVGPLMAVDESSEICSVSPVCCSETSMSSPLFLDK